MGLNNDLPKELIDKLEKWDKQKPLNRQVRAAEDTADMIQQMLDILERSDKGTDLFRKQASPILVDVREKLQEIASKESPKQDNKDIIKALENVEKTLKKIEVKPEFKPTIKVDTPEVNISPPSVDLKGIEKILRSELPKAFAEAISKIPETEIPNTDFQPLVDQYQGMNEILSSIDTAVRIRPEFPTNMTVKTGSTPVETTETTYDVLIATDSVDSNIQYIGKALPGSATSAAVWQIKEVDESSGTQFRLADGDSSFDNIWDNRESLSY